MHDTRTGTRRIEAALETHLEARLDAARGDAGASTRDGEDELTKAVRAWERLLKKIRGTAAPVRDLDVQRKLLKKLAAEIDMKTPKEGRGGLFAEQVKRLDDALLAEREGLATPLRKDAGRWAAKLDGHFAAFAAAMARKPASRRRKRNAAATALDAFARLASQMRQLDARNLHDFRKGAKKARYMAEAGGEDEHAEAVGKALKKLQDEIGDWHDWLMLADEAHRVLSEDGTGLTAEIERRRDVHYEMAMKVEGKMRGRLLGEGLAIQGARRMGTTLRGAASAGRGVRSAGGRVSRVAPKKA